MRADRFEDESLLRLAAIEVYEDAVREYQSLGEDDAPMLSQQQVDEQFKQLMARYRQEQRAHRFRSLPRKVLRRAVTVAAAIAILCSSAFTVAMASSPTIREIIMEDFGKYSDLVMLLGEQKAECPEGWEGKYYPTYIPEGYTLYKHTETTQMSTLRYLNVDEEALIFSIIDYGANVSIDTENMTKSEIDIKNRNAILHVGKGRSSVVINYGDCVIFIYGPVSEDVIIKVAENISER